VIENSKLEDGRWKMGDWRGKFKVSCSAKGIVLKKVQRLPRVGSSLHSTVSVSVNCFEGL